MRQMNVYRALPAFAAAVWLTAGGATLAASAASSPRLVLPDGSVRYDYGRRPAPVLECKPGYVCDIALDGGESVLNMAVGDAARWVIASGQSGPGNVPHVFVKPLETAIDTNLVITTTKHVYDVTLRSTETAGPSRVSFFYADEDAAEKSAIAEHERQDIARILAGSPAVGVEQTDSKYKSAGEPLLMPDKVFNDGVRTFVVWKTLPSELPAVVAIAKDGMPQAVNFRVVGMSYIIDGVNPNYDLVLAGSKEKHGRPERRASIRHL